MSSVLQRHDAQRSSIYTIGGRICMPARLVRLLGFVDLKLRTLS